jgi:hypothetical protein
LTLFARYVIQQGCYRPLYLATALTAQALTASKMVEMQGGPAALSLYDGLYLATLGGSIGGSAAYPNIA